ncbi:MAG: MBL fold metallo-hydrolase [candidate division Zixibacteria bacterium]|nr:MBL fold metallo-hydrolase [candidate division Zixibacteria bacterium]
MIIEFENGIHIEGTGLWLDARRKVDLSFVSHAHTDHAVRHTEILVTKETAKFYEHRFGKAKFNILEYNRPKRLKGVTVELFPSGHILGGAQILIEKDRTRIVYTGDFKLRKSLTAQKAEIKKCDILIMESTFGLPQYKFPHPREIQAQMVEFVEHAQTKGKTPIFLAYSLGKAQEAMKILSNRGFKLSVHGTIYNIAKMYEEFGVRFKNYKHYQAGNLEGSVLIAPPWVKKSRMIENIPRRRLAILTGWAMNPGAKHYYGVDEAIPLSDHADFSELIQYVKKAQPQKIYTVHGFAEFGRYLKEEGFDADPLKESTKAKVTFSKELLTNYDLFA